jgi:GABA(A) receptor-associated protein
MTSTTASTATTTAAAATVPASSVTPAIKSKPEASAVPGAPRVPFKKRVDFAKRQADARRLKTKYAGRYPVIVERASSDKMLPDLDKERFLVPGNIVVADLQHIIRKRIKLNESQALFMFFKGNTLEPATALVSQVYQKHKDEDEMLYVMYTGESTFGAC